MGHRPMDQLYCCSEFVFNRLLEKNSAKESMVKGSLFFLAGMVYGIGMTVFDTLLYRLPQPWIYYLQGVSFDLMHSIGNVVFFLVFLPVVKRFYNHSGGKNEKIIYSLLAMSVSILILTSCSTTYTQSASNQKEEVKTSQKATITLQENGQNFSEKEVFFKKGDDLLSILKRNFEVKEDNGFITSLEGHSQDEKNQLYWMFTVDGKSATTGAKEIKLNDGQSVIFNLSKL